jgi:hypothetical protein
LFAKQNFNTNTGVLRASNLIFICRPAFHPVFLPEFKAFSTFALLEKNILNFNRADAGFKALKLKERRFQYVYIKHTMFPDRNLIFERHESCQAAQRRFTGTGLFQIL